METSLENKITIIFEEDSIFNLTEDALIFLDLDKMWRIERRDIERTYIRVFFTSGIVVAPGGESHLLNGTTFVKKKSQQLRKDLLAMGAFDIQQKYRDVPLVELPNIGLSANICSDC